MIDRAELQVRVELRRSQFDDNLSKSEAGLNVSEAGLNQLNSSSSNGSEAPVADLAISRLKNLWAVLSEEEQSPLLKKLGLEKSSGANSSNQLQSIQNLVSVSNIAPSADVQTPSEHVQNLHNYGSGN